MVKGLLPCRNPCRPAYNGCILTKAMRSRCFLPSSQCTTPYSPRENRPAASAYQGSGACLVWLDRRASPTIQWAASRPVALSSPTTHLKLFVRQRRPHEVFGDFLPLPGN